MQGSQSVGRWNTRSVIARLEPGEALYASVRAVTSRRRIGGEWLSLIGGWYFFLGPGILLLIATLAYHPEGFSDSSFGLLGVGIVLLLLAVPRTRILAFTDRNVVVMAAPTTFFPTKVVERLAATQPIPVDRVRGWETIELRGQRFTVHRQGIGVLRRKCLLA